ncbi:HNH endonuclease [Bacillus paranthracis]
MNGAEFLGFVIRAEKARDSKTGNLVGKAFPNMKKLNTKITNLCNEIHVLKKLTVTNTKIAQIHYINSVIMGIAEYIKSGICSKAFKKIDVRVNHSCYYTWKRMYPNEVAKMRVKMNNLSNLPHRHEKYNDKTFAIKQDGMWIGVTKAYITHSAWEKLPFNEKMTPYTEVGRTLYAKSKKKPLPKNRPSINTSDELRMAVYSTSIYNFEYYMNREYAFNRDKGKCRCCGENLINKCDRHCHHVDKSMELNKINKISNLAWVCVSCHYLIHSSIIPENVNTKVKKKILKFQEVLNRAKFVK